MVSCIAIVLVILAVVIPTLSIPCVIPPLLQGSVIKVTHIAGDVTRPSVERSSFSYDAIGQRYYANVQMDDGTSYQIIKLFREKKVFKIRSDGTCQTFRKRPTDSFDLLRIPPSKYEVKLTKTNMPTVSVYSGSTSKGQFVITTLGNRCLPVSWTDYLPLGPRFLVKQQHFSGVEERVDFTRFKPPSTCGNARFIVPW